MLCPICGGKTTVTKTTVDTQFVYRDRKCVDNKYHRFKTVEVPVKYFNPKKEDENND